MVDVRTHLTTLAMGELENGDFIMATRILTTAIRMNPNNPELYFDRSICHYKLGDHQASLDDANAAIRLNATDYNIHYQKGLALLGLGLINEGIISFKKAIELRAIQEDSKLSHIFYLLRDAVKEVDAAKARLGLSKNQRTTCKSVVPTGQGNDMVLAQDGNRITHHNNNHINQVGVGNTDPVDSTTDRTPVSLLMEPGTSSFNRVNNPIESCLMKNGTNNLVATKRNSNNNNNINTNQQPVPIHLMNGASGSNTTSCTGTAGLINQNRVSSSASTSHNNNRNMSTSKSIPNTPATINILPPMHTQRMPTNSLIPVGASDLMDVSGEQVDGSRAAQFAWNIRRSERIFLHHTNEPLPPGASAAAAVASGTVQYGIIQQAGLQNAIPSNLGGRPSSINSSDTKGSNKRQHDSLNEPYQKQVVKSKEGTNSIAESEIDVDDSTHVVRIPSNPNNQPIIESNPSKRVMIAPSSSMPATSLIPSASTSSGSSSTVTTKDDSYSSKYKRLRRDRERARRGTSKLCTIKLSDLEELDKRLPAGTTSKRSMRVIAPIDGWLYSGQLMVDDSLSNNGAPQYVVKLDGDSTGSSYLFSQETVLNDVIKEVRVGTVSELRKGARICCYWSRQYKCLSTGVVTSRTFEATKSLVSVKYDNGDLSALPLEDLRLLPPDYPKYMSNCDPLLLARNGDGGVAQQTNTTATTTATTITPNNNSSRIVIMESKALSQLSSPQPLPPQSSSLESLPTRATDNAPNLTSDKFGYVGLAGKSQPTVENTKVVCQTESGSGPSVSPEERPLEVDESYEAELTIDETNFKQHDSIEDSKVEDDEDEDADIPPTEETIDFITSESSLKLEIDEERRNDDDNEDDDDDDAETDVDTTLAEQTNDRIQITKDNMNISATTETPLQGNNANTHASSEENSYGVTYCPWLFSGPPKRNKKHGRAYRDHYTSIRRGNEVIKVGDSAELMPRDESILPFIAKIDGFWATARGEMRVRVRWYYRLVETEGEPYEMPDGENALFETDHVDENDVQSIYRSTNILSWTDYSKDNLSHVNKSNDNKPKIFYLAGYYDPVRRIKHLRSDVKEAL